MADSRLNSPHLTSPRRRRYRDARERLLGACGPLTLVEEFASASCPGVGTPCQGNPSLTNGAYVLVGWGDGQRYPLRVGLNTVRRLQDNVIVFNWAGVSRRHCVFLVHTGGGCELHDTASRNGTLVNRQPVSRAWLTPGDFIWISSRIFVLRWEGGSEFP
jgi:hypothetical protein